MILIGLIGLLAAGAGVFIGLLLVEQGSEQLTTSLQITSDALDGIEDTIVLVDQTVGSAEAGLVSLRTSVRDAEGTLEDMAGVLREGDVLLGEEIPARLDDIRSAIPALIEAANLLDETLLALRIIGVDFTPDVPVGRTLGNIDQDLAELSDRIRADARLLAGIADDLDEFAASTVEVDASLTEVIDGLAGADSLVRDYERTAGDAVTLVAQSRADLEDQQMLARVLVIIFGAVVALGHLAGILIGIQLRSNAI